MEKVIKLLGGSPNGTPKTGVFDIWELLRNIVFIVAALASLSFAAGTYFGNAKDIPARVDTLERKCEVSESRQDAILQKIDALGVDVREIRTVVMRRRND